MSKCPQRTYSIKPFYQEKGITIYHGNCFEILPKILSGKKIDLILTDPPYGLGDRWKGGTWGHNKNSLHPELIKWDAEPITKSQIDYLRSVSTNQIIWGGNYFDLPISRCWLIWNKLQKIPTLADFEMAWTSFDRPSKSFAEGRTQNKHGGHPTEKPLDLFLWCLMLWKKWKVVLDPMMGSGTTLRAAKDLGRETIGIDINLDYCKVAVKKLQQESLPIPLESNLRNIDFEF
jgi:site-specific DNA-methyltransferase (adenine-specific)